MTTETTKKPAAKKATKKAAAVATTAAPVDALASVRTALGNVAADQLPDLLRTVATHPLSALSGEIQDIHDRYKGVIYDVESKEGDADARAARQEIRGKRIEVQKLRDSVVSTLADCSRLVKGRADELIEPLRQVEDPIHNMIAAKDERIEQERRARREAEQANVARQEAGIARIAALRSAALGADVAGIDAIMLELADMDFSDYDEVFALAAESDRSRALTDVQRARVDREAMDRQQAELERQRAELEAQQAHLRADADARRRLQDLQLASMGAPTSTVEWFTRQIARLADVAPDQYVPVPASDVEATLANCRALLEAGRLAAVEREENAALLAQAAQEKAEREAAARQADEERRKAQEAQAIASATLLEAATDAVGLLHELGQGMHLITRRLAAAVERSAEA